MKRILSIFFLWLVMCGFSTQLLASTPVGSTLEVDTQWDQSGSPYIIQGSVLVPPGVTLTIGPGVQVVFQGPATLHIAGVLKVDGSAPAPAVLDMTQGALQNALFIDGGDAQLSNLKVLNGVFLVQDATLRMDSSIVTRGSGLYLKGDTTAYLKNNTFYGNATGVVFDGTVEAFMRFNTLVQNTYGLYFKHFSKIDFIDNSIHDNDSQVVNIGDKVRLGGNYWGTLSPLSVQDKIRGNVSVSPLKGLKDILRSYLRTELPVITQSMSDRAQAEDIRGQKASEQALKDFQEKEKEDQERAIQEKNETLTPIATATSTEIATSTPTDTATSVDTSTPAFSPTLAPMPDISTPTSVPTPVPTEEAVAIPSPISISPTPASTSVMLPPPPITEGLPAPPVSSDMPAPPTLSSLAVETTPESVPEGAVGAPSSTPEGTEEAPMTSEDLAAIVATAQAVETPEASSTPSLLNQLPELTPKSTSNEEIVSPSPTPQGLGGPPVTSDDLAAMVATAQAAATSTTPVASPEGSAPAPPLPVSSDVSLPPAPDSTPVSIPAAPDLASAAPSIPSTDTFTPTSVVTLEMTNTPDNTDTPLPTDTWTSTPTIETSQSSAPEAPSSNTSPSTSANASSAAPPPPDLSDSSDGTQAPMVSVPSVSDAPPPSLSTADSNAVASTPSPDVDMDGLQAPPMDSGLDFSAPKK